MKFLICVAMTCACLFAAGPAPEQPAGDPSSESIVMVGFDRYRECELVNQALKNGSEEGLHYYVVSSDVINRELFPEFLKRVKRLHPYNNFTARELRLYWTHLFSAPIHVFVFCGGEGSAEAECDRFSHSDGCRDLVCRSLDIQAGFTWMGIMSVVEDRLKTLLKVPATDRLVATVFFGEQSLPYTGRPPEAR